MEEVQGTKGVESPKEIAEDSVDNQLTLERGFSFRAAFALGFADISPIVSIFTVFGIMIALSGAGFWLAMPIVLAGQLLIAAVFGDVASRFPLAGSVYQWSRYLVNTRYGWFTAWAYIWGLTIALATLTYGGAGFIFGVFNVTSYTHYDQAWLAVGLVVFGSAMNIAGRKILKYFFYFSIAAEVLSSVVLGTILLIGYRVNPVSALFHGAGGGSLLNAPFLAAIAVAGWSFLGFEAAGSIAEEVENPSRQVPKAIFYSLLAVGSIVLYASFAITMSVPDIPKVLAGQDFSPLTTTLSVHLGSGVAQLYQFVFLIGFVASFMAVQAAVTRCIWANARDRVLPAHQVLIKLTKKEKIPYNAVIFTGIVAAALPFINSPRIYAMLINFTSAGFMISYALPVIAVAWTRSRGKWVEGQWTLGKWGAIVTYSATAWVILEVVNIVWPRASLYGPGFLQWSVLYMVGGLALLGAILSGWILRDGGVHTRQGELENIEDFSPTS